MPREPRQVSGRDRPLLFALFCIVISAGITWAVVVWAEASPESVLLGLQGRHDAVGAGERLATCLDCHVPFVGTPSSRCLGPGCHGDLATGTPPRDGPAMPIRFHVALRDQPCGLCHQEHVPRGTSRVAMPFTHDLIPGTTRARCARCHSGAGRDSHPPTDAVACELCHSTERWQGVEVEHSLVAQQPCDVCHGAPASPAHASIAGNCSECHETQRWTPHPPTVHTPPNPGTVPIPPPGTAPEPGEQPSAPPELGAQGRRAAGTATSALPPGPDRQPAPHAPPDVEPPTDPAP